MKTINHNNRAFTLLELLVVLVMIGLVIAIAVPHVGGIIARARNTAIQAELARVPFKARDFRELQSPKTFRGFCENSHEWRRIRHAIETEHRMTGRVHCIDSPHFVAVSSGLHGLDHYWVVDTAGRNGLGSSVRGLVGYWRFQEERGATARDSATVNDGTLFSGATSCGNPPTAGCPTWRGGHLSFDGVNDWVDLGRVGTPSAKRLQLWEKMTYEAWVFIEGGSVGIARTILDNHGQDPGLFYEHGTFRWHVATVGGHINIGGYAPTHRRWYHLVGTYDFRKGANFYINGVLFGSSPITGRLSDPSDAGIGIGGGWAPPFHGLIDDVRIYNRALSPAEVAAQFEAGRWRI
jgi:prepilin-type N-terminal cleavage/methylation domain-containing protein